MCMTVHIRVVQCWLQVRMYHVTIPGTFVEVELPGNAPLFKEGFVLRKNIMEGPHKKGTSLPQFWPLLADKLFV